MTLRIFGFLCILGLTHSCGAHAAEVTAAPCMAPKPQEHHKRHNAPLKAEPVQSCVTPPVPMCFRDPAPEPDIEPLPAPMVVPYYINTPVADDETGEGPYVETGYNLPISAGGFIGVVTVVPRTVTPRYPSPPRAQAPEIDPGAGLGAVTLLAGVLVIIRGRRDHTCSNRDCWCRK
jgi:hypothetical protein